MAHSYDKMKFKIGDKVKVISTFNSYRKVGEIGVVLTVYENRFMNKVRFKTSDKNKKRINYLSDTSLELVDNNDKGVS